MVTISEERVYSSEPSFDDSKDPQLQLLKAMNWYRALANDKMCKEWIIDWFRIHQSSDVDKIELLPVTNILISYGDLEPRHLGVPIGIYCRMTTRGFPKSIMKDFDRAMDLINQRANRAWNQHLTRLAKEQSEVKGEINVNVSINDGKKRTRGKKDAVKE